MSTGSSGGLASETTAWVTCNSEDSPLLAGKAGTEQNAWASLAVG